MTIRQTPAVLAAFLCLAAGPVAASGVEFDKDEGLVVETGKDGPTFSLGGRLHADFSDVQPDVTPFDDGFLWRRVRPDLRMEWGDVRVRGEYEFGDVNPGWRQAWIEYTGFKHTSLKFGNQPIPFGLQETMSSNDLDALERPLPFAFAPGSLVGLSTRWWGDRWSATLGLFGNDIAAEDRRELDGQSAVVRLTGLPHERGGGRVHLGASVEYRNAKDNATLRYRSRPESYADAVRLVDTGTMTDVDSVLTGGVEAAWQQGPFMVSGEYLTAQVSRSTLPDQSFDGWYASAAWVLTGERRGYTESFGAFAGVNPRSKWGAVELRVRVSELDLEDDGITGGREQNQSFGINWYIERHIRVMLEHVLVDAKPNADGVDESPSITQLRLQVAF